MAFNLNDSFVFGKYKSQTLKWVIDNDIGYVLWALTNNVINVSEEAHSIIKERSNMVIVQVKTPVIKTPSVLTDSDINSGYAFVMQAGLDKWKRQLYRVIPVESSKVTKPVTFVISKNTEQESKECPVHMMFDNYVVYEPLYLVKHAIFHPSNQLNESLDWYVHYIKQAYLFDKISEQQFDVFA